MTLEKMKRSGLFVHLLGLVGVLFLGIAVSGLLGAFEPEGQAPVAAAKIAAASATDEPVATAERSTRAGSARLRFLLRACSRSVMRLTSATCGPFWGLGITFKR